MKTNLDERRELVGAGTGGYTEITGSAGVQSFSLHHSEVVARPQLGFKEERWATAAQLPLRDDGDPVT